MAKPPINKMLIDATHPEETRVVVLKNGRVEEFDFESAARKLLRGSIYLAKVTRVEPSLQAAFVDYGGNRHGFLAFNEIHPDYYQIPTADREMLKREDARAEQEDEDGPAEPAADERRSRPRRAGRRGDRRNGGGRHRDHKPSAAAPALEAGDIHDASELDDLIEANALDVTDLLPPEDDAHHVGDHDTQYGDTQYGDTGSHQDDEDDRSEDHDGDQQPDAPVASEPHAADPNEARATADPESQIATANERDDAEPAEGPAIAPESESDPDATPTRPRRRRSSKATVQAADPIIRGAIEAPAAEAQDNTADASDSAEVAERPSRVSARIEDAEAVSAAAYAAEDDRDVTAVADPHADHDADDTPHHPHDDGVDAAHAHPDDAPAQEEPRPAVSAHREPGHDRGPRDRDRDRDRRGGRQNRRRHDARRDDGDGDAEFVEEINGEETEGQPEEVETASSADVLEEMPMRPRRRMRSYKIQEVIKRRQIVLVQVVKEERGTKGAALTTYLSLAGRYTVLMPNTARGGGISRKITNAPDRKRLKEIANELDIPEDMGLIIRTAGASRTKQEIKRDFEYLLRLWESVRDLTLRSQAPSLVYEEGDLIKRSIRDLYSKEVDEILVAGVDAHTEARDFMAMLMPSHAKNVVLSTDPEPLFSRFGIEHQLAAMFSPQVHLPSGGYIVINQTEALVAIDVNSGKSTREFSIEETALNTNLEASDEVARQLRLRDLAGLIVIDYIDMDEKRNNRAVERRLKDALRFDRARIQVGRISHFGLLEMSRQRMRTSVIEGSTTQCPHCQGSGIVRSTESVALAVIRALEEALLRGARTNLVAHTTPAVAIYILNHKRRFITEMEARYGLAVFVQANDKLHGASFTIERMAAQVEAERRAPRAPVSMEWGFGGDEGEDADEAIAEPVEAAAPPSGAQSLIDDGEGGEGRRRRRRRRRGRGGRNGDEARVEGGSSAGYANGRDHDHDGEHELDGEPGPATARGTGHGQIEDIDDDEDDDVPAVTTLGGDGEADAASDDDRDDADEGGALLAEGVGDDGQRRRGRRRGRRGGRRSREGRPGFEGRSATDDGNEGGDHDASPGELATDRREDHDLLARDGDEAGPALAAAYAARIASGTASEAPAGVLPSSALAAAHAASMASGDEAVKVSDAAAAAAPAPSVSSVANAAPAVVSTDAGSPQPSAPVEMAAADAEAEAEQARRARIVPVSSEPVLARVVIGPDAASAAEVAPVEEAKPKRGWWRR